MIKVISRDRIFDPILTQIMDSFVAHNLILQHFMFKEAKSVTMNTFRKKKILFKSFVKIELNYVFTINMFSTAENYMEK